MSAVVAKFLFALTWYTQKVFIPEAILWHHDS